MRFAVETTGTVWSTDEPLDRHALELVFDQVADALAAAHDLEADVAMNLETSQLEFFVIVEATDSRAAFASAYEIIDGALLAAEVRTLQWSESHTRRADLVAAG